MISKILHIQSKNRTPTDLIAKLEDFEYVEGEAINPQTIINKSNVSLYCLDPQKQRAIFVETPLDIDISQPPFFYQAQYEYAQRLFAVPFKELRQLARSIEPIKEIIIIYSVGRCGSTLLSKVFNQVDSVLSLSEPDVFSQLVGMRCSDGSNDDRITELLGFCLAFLRKKMGRQEYLFCAIKLRSFCIHLGDLINLLVPYAKVIFLYRNAEDTVKSYMRAFPFVNELLPTIEANIDLDSRWKQWDLVIRGKPLEKFLNPAPSILPITNLFVSYPSRFIPLLNDYANYIDFKNCIDLYTTLWLSVMERYLLLYKQRIPTCAIRYEDLVAEPHQIVTLIFEKCAIPITEVVDACKVFEKDSQSGSHFSQENTRKNQITRSDIVEIRQKVNKLLKKNSEIQTADFIVPGTLTLPAPGLT